MRVSGRFPFATLAGLTAAGLALGGAAGQVTAVVSRRRLSWIGAGLAGIATGFGGALVGQQFGRLQLSYWSLFLSIVGAGAIGALVALLLRERLQPRRREPRVRRRESRSGPRHKQEAAPEPVAAVDTGQMRADQFGEHTVDTKSHAISPNGGPYWCYVDGPLRGIPPSTTIREWSPPFSLASGTSPSARWVAGSMWSSAKAARAGCRHRRSTARTEPPRRPHRSAGGTLRSSRKGHRAMTTTWSRSLERAGAAPCSLQRWRCSLPRAPHRAGRHRRCRHNPLRPPFRT